MTEQEEDHLHWLQRRSNRLNTDAAYADLIRYCQWLEKQGK